MRIQVPVAVGVVGGEAQPLEPDTVEMKALPLYITADGDPLGNWVRTMLP